MSVVTKPTINENELFAMFAKLPITRQISIAGIKRLHGKYEYSPYEALTGNGDLWGIETAMQLISDDIIPTGTVRDSFGIPSVWSF